MLCDFFKKRNLCCLRECQNVLMRFIRLFQGLLVLCLGINLCFFFDNLSDPDLVLSILLSSGSYLYLVFTFDFRLFFLLGRNPYRYCRAVATASPGYLPGTLSH